MARAPQRLVLFAPVWAAISGCGEPPPVPDADQPPELAGDRPASAAPARYVTTLAFAGGRGPALIATFTHETSETTLLRTYDAWLATGPEWEPLLEVRDTLPIPRAAWRILPAATFQLQVGNGAQIVGLRFGGGDAPARRVRVGGEIEDWMGPTGQRESWGLAAVEDSAELHPGFLFFRRAARALGLPGSPIRERVFLLADTLGNALLIETEEVAGAPASARSWLHGASAAWTGVGLVPIDLPATGEGARGGGATDTTPVATPRPTVVDTTGRPLEPTALPLGWTFDIPDAGLRGRITRRSDGGGAAGGPGGTGSRGPDRAHRVTCELFVDEEVFRFEGLLLDLSLP